MSQWCLQGSNTQGFKLNNFFNLTENDTLTYINPLVNDMINGKTLYLVNGTDCIKFHTVLWIYSETYNFTGKWILLHVTDGMSEVTADKHKAEYFA